MVTAPAAAHMAVTMSMAAPNLNYGIILRRQRGHAEPRRGGAGQRQRRCEQRHTDNQNTFHVSSRLQDCDLCNKFPLWAWFRLQLPFFPDLWNKPLIEVL
jgi:hypothetical protein